MSVVERVILLVVAALLLKLPARARSHRRALIVMPCAVCKDPWGPGSASIGYMNHMVVVHGTSPLPHVHAPSTALSFAGAAAWRGAACEELPCICGWLQAAHAHAPVTYQPSILGRALCMM